MKWPTIIGGTMIGLAGLLFAIQYSALTHGSEQALDSPVVPIVSPSPVSSMITVSAATEPTDSPEPAPTAAPRKHASRPGQHAHHVAVHHAAPVNPDSEPADVAIDLPKLTPVAAQPHVAPQAHAVHTAVVHAAAQKHSAPQTQVVAMAPRVRAAQPEPLTATEAGANADAASRYVTALLRRADSSAKVRNVHADQQAAGEIVVTAQVDSQYGMINDRFVLERHADGYLVISRDETPVDQVGR